MDDPTFTQYTIHAKFFPLLKRYIRQASHNDNSQYSDGLSYTANKVLSHSYNPADYGRVEPIEIFMETMGIPYDCKWENGRQYNAGCKEVRFEDGYIITHDFEYANKNTISITDALQAYTDKTVDFEAYLLNALKRQADLRKLTDYSEHELPNTSDLLGMAIRFNPDMLEEDLEWTGSIIVAVEKFITDTLSGQFDIDLNYTSEYTEGKTLLQLAQDEQNSFAISSLENYSMGKKIADARDDDDFSI